MRYLPHTQAEIQSMLANIGVPSLDALFEPIPQKFRLERPLNLEPALDEDTLMRHLEDLARKNSAARATSFLGAGMYDHFIPPAVDQLLLRSEFYTAYTPYQAELSQGTLQTIFEFQTIVSALFGMDVSNASMYDGASAAAEAVLTARRITGREHVVLSAGLHPEYICTVQTYLQGTEDTQAMVHTAPLGADGRTDLQALRQLLNEQTSAVVVGYPNFFGCVEDLEALRQITNETQTLLITATMEPYALSLLQPPGAHDVDIAVGEGQALAVPPQFGGPGVGLFTCKQKYVQKMPGRLVGQTVDARGKRGFVLTLSTREQHIRRERATSNICTNHGLIALALTIRTAMLGKNGFVQVGKLCLAKAEYLKQKLLETKLFTLPYSAPTFNEFTLHYTQGPVAPVLHALSQEGILAGIPLSRFYSDRTQDLLLAVTERHRKEDLDNLVQKFRSASHLALSSEPC